MFILVDPNEPKPSMIFPQPDPRYNAKWAASKEVDTVTSVHGEIKVGMWVHPNWRPIDLSPPAMRSEDV